MRVAVFFAGLFASAEAVTQEIPDWVTPLPFGEIQCRAETSSGFEWREKTGGYKPVTFPARTFTIQRLDASDPKYASFNCGPDEDPGGFSPGDGYTTSSCYRYNNAGNMLGWIQGWCAEKYQRDGTVHVTCEAEKDFEPRIGFSPNGYFYSYGRGYTFSKKGPFITVGFTEIGRCSSFREGYVQRFKLGRKSAYYAPVP